MAPVDRDLPVAVELPEPLAGEVAAYVEGEAGWQVVGLDGPPRPALVLAEAPLPGRATVVVVSGAVDPARLRADLQAGALDVLAWPHERGRLHEAAARAAAAPAAAGGPPLLRVGGAAGGVGTSTVALAVAGLLAWAGRSVAVVGDDDLLLLAGLAPWRGPGTREVALLDALDAREEVAALARPVPGVRGLRALGGGARALASVAGWPADVVVADVRAQPAQGCDLCCARPDAHLRHAGAAGAGGARGAAGASGGAGVPTVLVGDGPLPRAAVRHLLGREPAVWLPHSRRVARAAARGRVPADVPGTWLSALRAALAAARIRAAG